MHPGRQGSAGRIKVKCENCGLEFKISRSVYNVKIKQKDPKFFHVMKCYLEWNKRRCKAIKEAKEHGV